MSGHMRWNRDALRHPTQASQAVRPPFPESLGCWHGAAPLAPRTRKADLREFQ
jgi:hypothetical protein